MRPRAPRGDRRPARRAVTLALAGALVAGGCSDSSDGAGTKTPDTVVDTVPTELSTPASVPADSTPVATAGTEPAGTDAPATTAAPAVLAPLTGLPLDDESAADRPAMVVKIDNHPDARPQTGLNEADLVYEENVEGQTRFAAVFQSTLVEPVGPIRSGRTQDVDLLGSLNRPVFAWSGGNARVSAAITASDLVPVNETRAGEAMFRDKARKSPHNLYGHMEALYEFAPDDAGPPGAQFQYRAEDAAVDNAGVAAADGVKLSMDGIKVRWQWDAASGSYLRFSDDQVHTDALTGDQVSTHNVVVLYVLYKPSPADEHSPEAQTTGYGIAWVFTGGKVVKGVWARGDRLQPFNLMDDDGEPIRLTPGRTFVELARTDRGVVVPAGSDPAAIRYP